MDEDSGENLMKWIYDDPSKSGPYLCAVMGQDKPVLMYWNATKKGGYWTEGESVWDFHNHKDPNVLYYMDMNDIPMPEGW